MDFDAQRWQRIKTDAHAWWAGELDRPLIQLRIHGQDPGRTEPSLPAQGFTSAYPLDTPAEAIVDRWDYDLSRVAHHGDAFPCVMPNFGPGVMAAYLGADLTATDHTTWFHPREELEIGDIRFAYDPSNPWLHRMNDLYQSAVERWQGQVLMAMTDLGGNLDILSTFRPSERLLLDLYDAPAEVKRLTREAHHLWHTYFAEHNRILHSTNPGYSAWTPIFSESPYYILQCDFCYMISPEMFDEFVKPELVATCRRLANSFYHLDGPGQLAHLDSVLAIPELKGVQWIPGDGQPDITQWPDVYRRIRDAGKRIQFFSGQSSIGFRALDIIAEQLGDARGMVMVADAHPGNADEALAQLARYGAEH
jgi:5-methyltetrahydrofolate--homocysteine methyltransferase